jgi:hypothetical protein
MVLLGRFVLDKAVLRMPGMARLADSQGEHWSVVLAAL